ncbi:MAG: transcriptional repressor, partial [Myxococcota bacterium]
DHIICTLCGRIVEFVDDRIEELQELIAKKNGFKLTHHRMELYGECLERCEKKD